MSVSVIGAVAHHCLTNLLSILKLCSCGWKSDKSDKLIHGVPGISLKKLEESLSAKNVRLDNSGSGGGIQHLLM